MLHNHQTVFLFATQYGHINSKESKTFNMNYSHKIINKRALPFSACLFPPPSLHSKLLIPTRTLTRHKSGDASGTHVVPHVGWAGGWCWWPVGAKPSSAAGFLSWQDTAAFRSFRHPWDTRTTKGFKHPQQQVPSYTRNKPAHFVFFKINATLIVEYWIQTVENSCYSY